MTKKETKIILAILDWWGHREDSKDNAVKLASTPVFDKLWQNFPHAFLETSGAAVGLPDGQMGNSEVGHLNIGSGRIIEQDLPKIDRLFKTGDLFKNKALIAFTDKLKTSNNAVHLMGLLSPGGVHSHQEHLIKMANYFSEHEIKTYLHVSFDGRDVGPKTALEFLKQFQNKLANSPNILWATGAGRFYSMDRDSRYERTEAAYRAIHDAKSEQVFDTIAEGIEKAYQQDISDEFITPFILKGYKGIQANDALCMLNFRSDRVRQILHALLDPAFEHFKTGYKIKNAIGFSNYSNELSRFITNIIPENKIKNTLSEILSNHKKTQFHTAETEKYPHVTYFFNGGEENAFTHEKRSLIPSPKVKTYDLQPEMSAFELTDTLIEELKTNIPDFTIINFANPDMVGHCGQLKPAIKAVEAVDKCLGKIITTTKQLTDNNFYIFITADHGNCEEMVDYKNNTPHTSHTINPVPAILFSTNDFDFSINDGKLCDIAPTILEIFQIVKPKEMTGRSLLKHGKLL